MKYRVDGPIPVFLTETDGRPAIDIGQFLTRAVFAEVFNAADNDEGIGEEFADMHSLSVSAQHQGNDSNARHEFDDRMDKYLGEFAAGGLVELSVSGLRQLRDAIDEALKLRSVSDQHEAGAA